MKLRNEVAVYDYQAVASKFTAHDTQFNVVQGKINALVSESEITTLINGGKTMYSRLAAAEIMVDSISTQVSDQILGDAATSLKSRISTVEQTASSITSRVSAVETNGVTKTNLVSVINQKAGQVSVKILKGADNNDTVQTLLKANADSVRLTTGNLSWKATNSEMTQDGTLKCKNAELTGKITATSGSFSGTVSATAGSIGNWTISTDGIYKTVGNYEVRLRASTGGTDAAIRVRNTNTASNTFYVRNDGYLYASNVDIKGKVSATSGAIGGWTINASSIYKTIAGYTTALSAAGTTTTGKVLYVKKDSAYPFYIRADGYMYAAAGQFKGELVAATGTFAGNLSAAGGTFKGSLSAATGSFSGAVTATSGQIGRFKISNYGFRWDYPENSTGSNWTHRMFIQGPRNDGSGGAKTADGTAYFSAQKMINGKPMMVAWIYGNGDLGCSGRKTRVVKTSDGATRGLYAFESAVPYFMDCGKATTGANDTLYEGAGYVQIPLNPTFLSATINKAGDAAYFVFVQPIHESGNLYVTRMRESFRVVGTPNCEFFWFAYIVQDGYANERMTVFDLTGQE